MKNISYALLAAVVATPAFADLDSDSFVKEITRGVDVIVAPCIAPTVLEDAPGALGAEVYETADAIKDVDTSIFIPTSMYMRIGGGLNLGFASSRAQFNDTKHKTSGSYTTQIGLGWNVSSYFRTELDFQTTTLKFSDIDNLDANYQTLGGMLYFDLVRRFVQIGEIPQRRIFVPFIGAGAAFGAYRFNGENGAEGTVFAAPRAVLGFNIAFNNLIGLDVYYQYQMMIGNGFGWNNPHNEISNLSNIMASFRANF